MFQDIHPHKYNITYTPKPPKEEDILLLYQDDQILVRTGKTLDYPRCENLRELQYLFSIDDKSCFLYTGENLPQFPHTEWKKLSEFREAAPRYLAFIGLEGAHIWRWYQQRRFCGRCGAPMRHSETERAMICDRCNLTYYPMIAPAVIVAVTDGNKLLLTHYADRSYKNYSLIAGFCEVGERLEDAVRREVREEVGLSVKNIRYYKSQPWAFSDSLLVGFFCDVDGGKEIHVDGVELAEAEWYERDKIPYQDRGVSLTGEMIDLFQKGKEPI